MKLFAFCLGIVVAGAALGVWFLVNSYFDVTKHESPKAENENGPGLCGRERWAVKTMTDPQAAKVNILPQLSTITALGKKPAPTNPDALFSRTPEEMKVYTVSGLVIGAKTEADSDIHLALADPKNTKATMIAEMPAPYCDGGSPVQTIMDNTRAVFISDFGKPPTDRISHSITECLTLTGVFFFDRIHGQYGVAPNGAELHPLLAFQRGCP